jgi:hypothetical protein
MARCGAVPGHHGFALIRDADRCHVGGTDPVDHGRQRGDHCIGDLVCVVFHEARCREVLSELTVLGDRWTPVEMHGP